MTPQQVYHAQIDSLQTIYKNAKWTLHEIDYYAHSHNVRDEGYGMIADYAEQQKVRFEKAKNYWILCIIQSTLPRFES